MDYKKPQSTIVHGGAGIYPLTTADQVILADGSRLEKDGKISADSAADGAKLGGKAPEYYIQPRNLLDNSDFRNPVNQRGITSWYAEIGIDRWYVWPSANDYTAEVTDAGILVTIDGSSGTTRVTLQQRFPKGTIDTSKTYTMAAYYNNGVIKIGHTGINDSVVGNPLIDTNNADFDYVNVYVNNGECVVWAAFYEGSYTADTLPPYVPKGYAAELAECRLYYRPEEMHCLYCYSGGHLVGASFEPMRITPTAINAHAQTMPGTSVSGETNIVITQKDRFSYVANSNFSAGSYYRVFMNLSADL